MTDALPCPACGAMPHYKHVEAQQAPYRGLFQAMVARVDAMSQHTPVYQRDLHRWLVELWQEQPAGRDAFALNTTMLGSDYNG